MILMYFDSFIVSVFWNKHSVDEIKINLIFLFSVKTFIMQMFKKLQNLHFYVTAEKIHGLRTAAKHAWHLNF